MRNTKVQKIAIVIQLLFLFKNAICQSFDKLTPLKYDSLANQFYKQQKIDSCLFYLNLAAPLYRNRKDYSSAARMYANIFGINYFKGDLFQAQKAMYELKPIYSNFLTPKDDNYYTVSNNIGAFYKEKGHYEKALNIYLKALETTEIPTDLRVKILTNTANIYGIQGDQKNSLNYLKNALDYAEIDIKKEELLPSLYSRIGAQYCKKELIDSAIYFYRKSYNMLKNDTPITIRNKRFQVENLLKLSEINIGKLQYQESANYLVELLKLYSTDYKFKKYKFFIQKGQVAELFKKVREAENNYNLAKFEALIYYKALSKAPSIARPYEYSTDFYFRFGKLQNAYTDALKGIEYASTDKDSIENTIDCSTIPNFIDKTQGLKFLRLKAQIEKAFYDRDWDLSYLEKGVETYTQIYKVNRQLRNELYTTKSALDWSSNMSEVYRDAFDLCVLGMQEDDPSKQEYYLEKAFFFAEAGRAVSLSETIDFRNSQNDLLPDTVSQQDKNLRADIAFYRKQITKEKQKESSSDSLLQVYNEQLFDLQNQHQALLRDIDNNYPGYARRRESFEPVDTKKIQHEVLDSKTALLEFQISGNHYQIIALTKDSVFLVRAGEINKVQEELPRFLELISRPPEADAFANEHQEFIQLGESLYKELLAECIPLLPQNIENLILIPEESLALLPFELLLSQEVNRGNVIGYASEELPYLFEDYNISYNYSSTVLNTVYASDDRKNSDNNLIFSPLFGGQPTAERACDMEELSFLKCNQEEGKNIQNIVGGQFFDGLQATSVNFAENLAEEHGIIHLATHACRDSVSNTVKLFFTDDFLTNEDFNSMSINADLVVLSACNSGNGVVNQGEGVMSLARSIFYAGARSSLMSFRAVDDCVASELIVDFYRELAKGNKKSEALRQAKLNYIEKSDLLHQHPYFWSTFAVVGNDRSIVDDAWSSYLYWLMGGALVVGVFFLFLRGRF